MTLISAPPTRKTSANARPAWGRWRSQPAEWVVLAPLGEWPHHLGRQIVDASAATQLVRAHTRRWRPAPIYLGHPDDPAHAGPNATRALAGRILALRQHGGALEGRVRWTALGRHLVNTGALRHLSPRWAMEATDEGAFRPVRLLSAGLTNQPNLPMPALRPGVRLDPALAHALGLPGTATDPAAHCRALAADARRWRREGSRLAKDLADASASAARASEQAREAAAQLRAERQARLSLTLEVASRDGRVPPGEREAWAAGLQANPERGLAELAAARPTLKTRPRAHNLRPRTTGTSDLASLARAEAEATGEPYAAAWQRLKTTRPELFA